MADPETINVEKVLDLVRELHIEAWHEGFHAAIYGHTDHGHTVKNRQQMLNHCAIKERIVKEIRFLLKGDE